MALYIYMYGGQKPTAMTDAWPHPWFGLTADTEEELHPFAEDLGMYRHFYRPPMAGSEVPPLVGHYDRTRESVTGPLAKGAIPQTQRQHDKMLRQLARERGIKLR